MRDPSPLVDVPSAARDFGPLAEAESPFTALYHARGTPVPSLRAEVFASFMGELADREFEEAVTDLAHELAAVAAELPASVGDDARWHAEVERGLRDHLVPVERESNALIDRMLAELEGRDLSAMSEAEIDAVLDRLAPTTRLASPVFDQFVSRLYKKAKKAVKAATKKLKKLIPLRTVLEKLKAVVKPLLEQVLTAGMSHIPENYRPAALIVAKQLLGLDVRAPAASPAMPHPSSPVSVASSAAADLATTGDTRDVDVAPDQSAAPEPAELAREADIVLAGEVVLGEPFSSRWAQARATHRARRPPAFRHDLRAARRRFTERLLTAEPGSDPTPAVEEFVTVALQAARIAIAVIGRPKVVAWLSKQIARLIKPYVGKDAALALSRALVDAGLRMAQLEVAPVENLTGALTIAATVEDAINRVAARAPASAWANEALLEAYVQEAFERAAAGNFPDVSIRDELHETATLSGAWIDMPRGDATRLFKKYSVTPEIVMSPQIAGAVRTFAGDSLLSALHVQLGSAADGPVRVRVHLYEAVRGTWLSRITMHEQDVRGLGHEGRQAWSHLHLLTPETAGILLREPGLGSREAANYHVDRNRIQVGQRFYYLEPLDAALASQQAARAAGTRPSHISMAIDMPASEIRLHLYYGEREAQHIAASFEKLPVGAMLRLLLADFQLQLPRLVTGSVPDRLRIVHEALPTQEQQEQQTASLGWLADAARGWLEKAVQTEFDARYEDFARRFRAAAADGADGVTVIVACKTPSMDAIRSLFMPGTLPGILDPRRVVRGLLGSELRIMPGLVW